MLYCRHPAVIVDFPRHGRSSPCAYRRRALRRRRRARVARRLGRGRRAACRSTPTCCRCCRATAASSRRSGTFLAAFGSLDQLYVVFTAPDGHAIADYTDDIDDWVDRLRQAPEIARSTPASSIGTRDFGWLADRQLLLLGGAVARHAPAPPAARRACAAASPRGASCWRVPSPQMADLIRQDPVGLFRAAQRCARRTRRRAEPRRRHGRATSRRTASGRLVIAQPAAPAVRRGFLARARRTAARDRRRRPMAGDAARAGSSTSRCRRSRSSSPAVTASPSRPKPSSSARASSTRSARWR